MVEILVERVGALQQFRKAFRQKWRGAQTGVYTRGATLVSQSLARSFMNYLGHVYPDADGRHPHCRRSYGGRSVLQTHHFNSPGDDPTADTVMHSIMLAVPASLHRQVLDMRPPTRATAALVPWGRSSGIGLLVVNIAATGAAGAVCAVLDIAGRPDLTELQVAAREGKVTAGIASDADPAVTPLLAVAGLADALSEARSLRRLAARELVEAVADVRSILRTPAAHALLGVPASIMLDTITVNACPL